MKIINREESEELSFLRNLKQKNALSKNQFFIESLKVYKKAVESKINIIDVVTTKDVYLENKNYFNSDRLILTTSEILNNIIKFKSHTKVFAIGEIPDNKINLNEDIVLLNNITSPENVGAITRSALAFDIKQIVFDRYSLSPWNRRSVRVSTGNIFKFNTERIQNSEIFIEKLKSNNYEIISMANSPSAVSIKEYNSNKKKLIILGSEGHGISESLLSISDKIIKIPINNFVEHLNVGHAAAITFFKLKY